MTRAMRAFLRAIPTLRALISDDQAATAVEYGLILALMVVVFVNGFTYFGGHLQLMWNYVANVVIAH